MKSYLILSKGDLVRIPANTCIIQDAGVVSIIEKYKFTTKPLIGVFVEHKPGEDGLVFIDNDYWIINLKDINLMESKC